MAKYGLFCAKLRGEGFDVVADLIEKLQAERDALEQQRDELLAERAALLRDIKCYGGSACYMCAHADNLTADYCELDDRDCDECSQDECICKECDFLEHWKWRGEQE